jgi:hypothetical protein
MVCFYTQNLLQCGTKTQFNLGVNLLVSKLAQRFWSKTAPPEPDTDCWLWTGRCRDDGYGRFSVDGLWKTAHRFAYEMLVGPVPEGLELDHLCRNRRCVNPSHLEAVTHQENMRRSPILGAKPKTHCPHGHSYSTAYIRKDGSRKCRECSTIKERQRRGALDGR